MANLTLGSLFDGSGGFPLGGLMNGITPIWASEIEPFPIRVTTKRLPFMKHYGDVSALDGATIEPVDIITFGSPCTDLSVAGRRAGLEGKSSSLFYEAIRIIKEMRCATHGKYPRYIVWENVPGAFSSNQGADFQAVLQAIVGVKEEIPSIPRPDSGKWRHAGEILGGDYSIAWRTLDAQYWGVPQRRRRIYLVADFAGQCAGDILFEPEGLSGHLAESGATRERTTVGVEAGVGASGLCLNDQGGDVCDRCQWQMKGAIRSGSGQNLVSDSEQQILGTATGNRMDVTQEFTCTLRAEAHHPPCVLESAGFCPEHSADSRGIGYQEECSPTLRAGTVPAAIALDNHPADSRVQLSADGNVQTLTSRMGTGGGNIPLVLGERLQCMAISENLAHTLTATDYKGVQCVVEQSPKTLKIRSGCEGGGKGALIQDNKSATLSCNNDQTLFVPTAFGICSKDSNSMKSANPHSGIYTAETSRTLDGNGGNPSCNQGGIAVVAVQGSVIGRDDKNGPQGSGVDEFVSFTLNTVDHHAVAYGIDRGAFNQGMNAQYPPAIDAEQSATLVARGPNAVAQPCDCQYIVRRLTPTECARLQGFPDDWCSNLGCDNPTADELALWREIFETHRRIMGKSGKPKSENQLRKWLKDPHSDSAEYKMWGNGVALPCVCFVLSGIVRSNKKSRLA